MTTEGWIFMVGFRVFDVGLLIIWLVWFFRLRNDDDAPGDEGGGGGGGSTPPRRDGPGGGGGFALPLGRAKPGLWRRRDHAGGTPWRPRRRGVEPMPRPLPARVRRPRTPIPARRT